MNFTSTVLLTVVTCKGQNMEIIKRICEIKVNLYQTEKEMNSLKKQGACLEDINIEKSRIDEIQDEIKVQTDALQQEAAPTVTH